MMPLTFARWTLSDEDARAAALAFDGRTLTNYDFGGRSVPDEVDVSDIGRLIGGHMVGFDQDVAVRLIERGRAAPWSDVPVDARLEDAAPGSALHTATCGLLDFFDNLHGVGPAIASKLLGLKRPTLIPGMDSHVLEVYSGIDKNAGRSWPTLLAIRDDVCQPDNIAGLDVLRSALRAVGSGKALRLAQLPALRLRDLVLWQRYEMIGGQPSG